MHSFKLQSELFKMQQLVKLHFIMRYRRSYLGYVWSLMNPILYMAVTATVFSLILRFPLENYVIYLFSGLVPWMLINSAVTAGGRALLQNEALIKKIYIPKLTFMASTALALTIDSLLSFIALLVFMVILKSQFSLSFMLVIPAYFLCFIFAFSCVILFSLLFVFFRDLEHLTVVIMQALFYLTPVIYPLSAIPLEYQAYFHFNPLYPIITIFQNVLYSGVMPSMQLWLQAILVDAALLLFAILAYFRLSQKLAFRF